MNIVFICAVFPPEPAPSGVMAHELASYLVRQGHDITMIVPLPSRPQGSLYPGYRMRVSSRAFATEGYSIVRCATWPIGKRRLCWGRLLENVVFGISSAWATLREGRPDLVLLETWPLFAPLLPAMLCRFWRIPYFYYVKDVFPETAEVAGLLSRDGTVAKVLRVWDRLLCMWSRRVLVISQTMRDLMASSRRIPLDRFEVIRDWIDDAAFPVWRRNTSWRASHHIAHDTFVAMFAGTMGYVSGADILVRVAQLIVDKRVILLCIGEGLLKESMRLQTATLGLRNLCLLPFQPAERVPEVQGSADAMLLTVAPNQSDTSVPSKLISYLAASRPIICAAKVETAVAQTVLDAGAGIVVTPGDAEAIAGAIVRLMRNREEAEAMGHNGRSYFEKHYTLERATVQFSLLFEQTTNANGHLSAAFDGKK